MFCHNAQKFNYANLNANISILFAMKIALEIEENGPKKWCEQENEFSKWMFELM